MTVFISYSHSDREFVDRLAVRLRSEKHSIWLDRWELGVGDSLTQKVQGALTSATAILVVLSSESVRSSWCQRELSAGLIRELEEQKTIVLPLVIEDCNIPIFVRDKLYADFRNDPDGAFDLVNKQLSVLSAAPARSRYRLRVPRWTKKIWTPVKFGLLGVFLFNLWIWGGNPTGFLYVAKNHLLGWWYQSSDLQKENQKVDWNVLLAGDDARTCNQYQKKVDGWAIMHLT